MFSFRLLDVLFLLLYVSYRGKIKKRLIKKHCQKKSCQGTLQCRCLGDGLETLNYIDMTSYDGFRLLNSEIGNDHMRYIHVLHVGFDNQVHEGELVVNKDIADDVLEIFKELYEYEYQIEKVRLIDEYDADDEASMSDNNSSAFNFRFISHTTKISKHGMGMAVDINTLYLSLIHISEPTRRS